MSKQKTEVIPAASRALPAFPPPEPEPLPDNTPLEAILSGEPALMEVLHRRDYFTVGQVRNASDEELLKIYGILPTRLKTLRNLTGVKQND